MSLKSSIEYVEGEIGDDEFLWYWYNGNGDGMDLDTRKFEITAYDSDSASVMLEMTVQDFQSFPPQ